MIDIFFTEVYDFHRQSPFESANCNPWIVCMFRASNCWLFGMSIINRREFCFSTRIIANVMYYIERKHSS